MSHHPSRAARVLSVAASLVVLGVIGVFFVLLHAGPDSRACIGNACAPRAVEERVRTVIQAPRASSPSSSAEAPAPEATSEWIPATELPIQVSVETGRTLRRYATTEGREELADVGALDPWERVMLGRFLAIDDLVVEEAERVGIDPLWLLMVLSSESALQPTAKGPEDGDRGLGQVGFASEDAARAWAADPESPYYREGYNAGASIWEPRQNLVLASIVLRSLYAMPDVTSHEQAYARYTHGLSAVEDGQIADRSQTRVDRALGYEAPLRQFFAIRHLDRRAVANRDDRFDLLTNALVADMLALDTRTADGMPMYLALRDLYLAPESLESASPWAFALNVSEALDYTVLAGLVEDAEPEREFAERIIDLIDARRHAVLATGDAELIRFVERVAHDAQTILDGTWEPPA